MAVFLGKSPIIMTAQGDTVADDGRNWCVSLIRFIASSGGEFVLLDRPGGRVVAKSATLSAGQADDINFDSAWMDGFYFDSNPGGEAHVFYR